MKKAIVISTVVVAVALLSAVLRPRMAFAGPASCDKRVNNTFGKLLECVTRDGALSHLAAFQAIADANTGIRTSGTPGYDASVAYAASVFQAAGYHVTVQEFLFYNFSVVGPSELEQIAPNLATYVEDFDFNAMDQSEAGDVTAAVTAVDLQFGLGNTSTSGCDAADFFGFPAGNIALIQRGTCTFEAKAENAAAAGAVGVIIFNQGNNNTPARMGLFGGTLGNGYAGGIPVLNATYARGVEWASTPGLVLHMFVNVLREEATTTNILAETRGGDPNNVIMVGAHLDSVNEGPGINDNGSGSAAILEVARQMGKVKPVNKVRFALWGAEESGLVGSNYYVANLSPEALAQIALYLNFDMIGSPNYVRFIYDGDGSAFGLVGPPGSDVIETLFEDFYAGRGLASEPTAFSGRSDYLAFINNGIPAGGLFTGAEEIKTAAQAAIYGGTAGMAYDPCYHQACDTYANVNPDALDVNADAVAFATLQYAMNTQVVNGLPGKGNFKPDPSNSPEYQGSYLSR